MMNIATFLYQLCACLLGIYTVGTVILLGRFLLKRRLPTPPKLGEHPSVTIQLPIYNERFVVARLLEAVAELDYPADRLAIQLLDDSSDATSRIAARKIAQLRQRGLTIQHMRRRTRDGYKAGALQEGMTQSATTYYAIFDADFVPPPDFLQRLIPYLEADPQLGMVQGRWGHLNEDENALTIMQGFAIDAHFMTEQVGRSHSGLFSSFNGTGGVWRAACIRDAGNWADTTLTEDLDLSYRAQLRGWRMLTLPDVVVPGELPAQITAFKRQQARWAKGTMQCLGKTIRPLWQTPNIAFRRRVVGTLHLSQYLPYPLLVMLTMLAPLMILADGFSGFLRVVMGFSAIVPPINYAVSQITLYPQWHRRLWRFISLMIFGTGIALSNSLAMGSLLLKRQKVFYRTPKKGTQFPHQPVYALKADLTAYLELAMAGYSLWGCWVAWQHTRAVLPYLVLPVIAYGTVGLWSLSERVRVRHQHRAMQTVRE
jgi:cellulose synthase/poly-beta-1,6-N-acetylglucosamine synthase-like glycosyltransferase